MANTLKFGDGKWATGEGTALAFNDENENFKPLPFTFTRNSTATVVNESGLIEEVGNDVPRIDFKDNTKGALLLEPTRTNSLVQSNQFDTSWITNTATVVGGQVGVGNSNDAWLLSRTGTNGRVYQTSTSSGIQTLSIYAKSNTNNWLFLVIGSSETAYYDLQNGIVGTTSSSDIAKIEPIGNNGWYRCSLTFTQTNPQVRIQPALANNNVTGSGSIYIQNSQLEQGSYATSYIPTSGSAVTRVADSCNNGGNEQVINSTEGVLYFEGSFKELCRLGISENASTSNRILIGQSSTSLSYIVTSATTPIVSNNVSGYQFNQNLKIAAKYKQNDFALWVNGIEIITVSSGNTPTGLNSLDLKGQGFNFYGNIKDIKLYNTALTDAELATLTT